MTARRPRIAGPCSASWAAAVKPFASAAAACRIIVIIRQDDHDDQAPVHHTGHPPTATSWTVPEMLELKAVPGVDEVLGDQCQFGLRPRTTGGGTGPAC